VSRRAGAPSCGNLIRLWSRNGRSWTEAFSAITNAIRALPTDSVIIDGEAVCLREDGSPDFNALRSQRTCKAACLIAFDLLFIGGQDLHGHPLEERRSMLAALLKDEPYDGLWFSGEVEGRQGEALFRQACAMNLEGIVSKRKGRPYRSGPSKDWLKVRCPEYRPGPSFSGFHHPSHQGGRRSHSRLALGNSSRLSTRTSQM
jgi:bifunctional non-homologous end joining protein LigD